MGKCTNLVLEFPGSPVIENLPANAGFMGSIPGLGRFHMAQSNQAQAPRLLEFEHLEPMLCKKREPAQQWRPSPAINK